MIALGLKYSICALSLVVLAETAQAQDVQISMSVSGSNPPSFVGTTNLAEGSMVSFQFRGDIPGCSRQCGFADGAQVHEGKFRFIVSLNGGPVEADNYTLDLIAIESSGKLSIPFGDPTDPLRTVRYTQRFEVTNATTHMIKGSGRFLPLNLDHRYIQEERSHGHRPQ